MKLFRRKTWILISGGAFAALLIALFIHSFVLSVNAVEDNTYIIRILEITDPNSTASLKLNDNDKFPSSELDNLQGLDNVKIDTMTMKRFVTLRDNWDGKYDAVYIGKGAFSKKKIASTSSTSEADRKKAHNTTAVENDITKLKADEITHYYIDKGLPVLFREETFSDQQSISENRGILYEKFNAYRTANRTNVTFVKNLSELNTLTASIKDGSWTKMASLKQRPRLTLSNKPSNYSDGSTQVFESGDTLDFSIKLDNISDLRATPVRVKLYMNVDSSLPVTEDTVVASKELTSLSDTLSYTLPTTFSGPLYWRLEVSSTVNGFKDFDTGNILYKGIKPVIKVLQIMPASKTESSLKVSTNMNTTYLSKTDYYDLQITPKDMSWFNTYIAEHASTNDKTSGLNGNFDMVVFGFQDMYDRVTTPMLSEAAAKAVKAFAEETKQSLMLTHDTIFRDVNYDPSNEDVLPDPYLESTTNGVKNYNYWSSFFHKLVGQSLPRTYLGGNAVNTSTKVVPVNSGLLTQYPFNLDTSGTTANRYTVATTHDQFFPLNLERADVIPWYNISGSGRDTDDSYNHFYTYSVGNITFSGTGHTNTKFPDWEQKLFVNTMYRAFTGANHAPEITVYTPQDLSTKPTYQDKLTVSYSAADLDFKDKELITGIKISKLDKATGTYTEVDAMAEKTVQSGATVTQVFNNPLHEDGTLKIEITAKDKQGALATKTITLNVKKVEANLTISRSLSSNIVEKGQPLTITYNVKPNNIPVSTVDKGDQGVQKLVISDIQYSELFPTKLEFRDLSALGLTQSGNDATGYTLTKNLSNLTYHLSEDGLTYIPDLAAGISFTVSAVPTEKIHYLLDNSILSFEDLHSLQTATSTATASATESATTTTAPGVSQTPVPTQVVRVPPLGLAKDFNVFIEGNVDQSGGVDGRLAAGGNVTASGYGLAKAYTGDPKTLDALIVGGNLNYSNGSIKGNVIVGGTATVAGNGTIEGTLKYGSPIDFAAEFKYLRDQSDALTALTVNGESKRYGWGEIILKGTSSTTNVFKVNAADMTSTVGIDVPKGSTVILNIVGDSVTLSNKSFVFCSSARTITDYQYNMDNCKGADKYSSTELEQQRAKVIYNFSGSSSLTINSIAMEGTVLAPRAAIDFTNGDVYGTIIGASLHGGGHPANVPFSGETGLATQAPATATPTPSPTVVPTPSPTPAPVLPRMTMKFDALSFDSIVKVTGVTLSGGTISINTSLNMLPLAVILPADASPSTLRWTSLNPGIATVSNSGIVLGVAPGKATIRLSVTDASGTTFLTTADVTVITPELNIIGPTQAIVGTNNNYQASYYTVNDTIKSYEWAIKPGSNTADAVLTVDTSNRLKDQASLTAPHSGTVVLTAVAKTDVYPTGTQPREVTITFTNPVREISITGPDLVNVNETIPLTITVVSPLNADPAEYTWSLVGNSGNYAAIIPGANTASIELEGLKVTDNGYPVIVKASLNGTPTGSPVEATFSVTVGTRVTGLKLTDSVDIGVGDKNALNLFDINHLTVFPDTIQLTELVGKLEWTSSNPAVVTVSSGGKITGIVKGSATVTVTLKENPTIKSSVKVTVVNEDRY